MKITKMINPEEVMYESKHTLDLKLKAYYISQYICYSILANRKNIIHNSSNRFLASLLFLIGFLLSIKRKMQYKSFVLKK